MDKLPIGVDINNIIDHLRVISWEASDVLIYYSNLIKDRNCKIQLIKNKINEDPVTLADLEVNEIIIKRLSEKYKNLNWGILSEENVKNDFNKFRVNNDYIWILDPLDGTKDFIQGTGNYAMHLALNYKNVPVISVVLIPEKNEVWITDGHNVWSEKRDGLRQKPRMSSSDGILEDMTIVTSKNHRNNSLNNLIEKIKFKNKIVMGSIGCKIASILRGDADIYISLSLPGQSAPKDWDFAAPEAILKTAGGAITNLENECLSYNREGYEQQGIIIASNNKLFHADICAQIKEVIKKNDIFQVKS